MVVGCHTHTILVVVRFKRFRRFKGEGGCRIWVGPEPKARTSRVSCYGLEPHIFSILRQGAHVLCLQVARRSVALKQKQRTQRTDFSCRRNSILSSVA